MAGLQNRSRAKSDSDDLKKLLQDEDDLLPEDISFALVGAAAVEQALEHAIRTHFVIPPDAAARMFSDGPLNNFAAKIKMGFALGVYDQRVKDELDMVRNIRNTFAHSQARLTFESPEIVAGCDALWLPVEWGGPERAQSISRKKFQVSTQILFTYLDDSEPAGPRRYQGNAMFEILFE